MKLYWVLLLLILPIVSGLNCDIGTPQEVYGDLICVVNQTEESNQSQRVSGLNCEIGTLQEVYGAPICLVNQTEHGINHPSLSISNIYITNFGLMLFPSQPVIGWIIIFLFIGIILKFGYQYEKTFRAKVMNKIGFKGFDKDKDNKDK